MASELEELDAELEPSLVDALDLREPWYAGVEGTEPPLGGGAGTVPPPADPLRLPLESLDFERERFYE